MNNITNYNDFKNIKKVNEMQSTGSKPFQTTHGAGSYGGSIGDRDTYFANVHGNLAGAENTLIGSAAIRLFGFIKRKGMEIYIKMHLKPALGRIYMNGILRYAVQKGLAGPRKKEFFIIGKIENEEEVEFKNKVSFSFEGKTGSSCIVVGATVKTETSEPVLVDGKYICHAVNIIFDIKNNLIVSISDDKKPSEEETESEEQETESEEVQFIEPSEDEIKKHRDEYEKKLIDGAGDIEPSDDIKSDIQFLENTLIEIEKNTTATSNKLSDENRTFLNEWVKKLEKDIKLLKDEGIKEIDEILKKDDGTDKLGLQREKQEYLANVKALIEIRDKIKVFLSKHEVENNQQKVAETIIRLYNNFLLEKSAPVTVADKNVAHVNKTSDVKVKANKPTVNRLGDELQELAKNGETVDLNDPNFYKQFETNEVKKAVSEEILTDKPKLIKLQLAAEKIISGGVTVYGRDGEKIPSNNIKLENFWKRTVQDVLGMYSKFMIPGMVDPITITQSTPDTEKIKYSSTSNNSELGKISSALLINKNSSNEKFKNSATLLTKNDLSKISQNDYCILQLLFKEEKDANESGTPYVLQRLTGDSDSLKVFRILGKIEMDKIDNDFKEKDFTSLVKPQFNKSILPHDVNEKFIDSDFRGLKGIYIIANRQKNFSLGEAQNSVSILYLFSKVDTLTDEDWKNYSTSGNWIFKIKSFATDGHDRILDDSLKTLNTDELKKPFKTTMWIDEINKYKIITPIEMFIKTKSFDILKAKNILLQYYSNIFK